MLRPETSSKRLIVSKNLSKWALKEYWQVVSSRDNNLLTASFSVEEIWKAVCGLGKNKIKAPGPGGFTSEFLIHFWDSFKWGFSTMFKEFHGNWHVNSCLKENFICLIQKKDLLTSLKDFRPINLTSSGYRILVKVLVERLKKVMPSISIGFQGLKSSGPRLLLARVRVVG